MIRTMALNKQLLAMALGLALKAAQDAEQRQAEANAADQSEDDTPETSSDPLASVYAAIPGAYDDPSADDFPTPTLPVR